MNRLKVNLTCLFVLVFITGLLAQNQWVSDEEMQFKIKVPNNYTQKQMRDGSDKVLTLMSPDENVMVRVRAMPATEQFTTQILQQVFEQRMIQGAQRIMNKDGDLHGIPARAAAYTWNADGSEAVLGIYYIVQNGFAYIVWTAVPRNLINQRSAEADAIIDSFELIEKQQASTGGGLLGGLGNLQQSNSGANQNSTSTQPTVTNIPSTKAVPGYRELVSDDACVEHLYPEHFSLTSGEAGQSIWEDGSGVKMVVQTIFKQNDFKEYINEHVKSIENQGASIVKNQWVNSNGNPVASYSYEYAGTLFSYSAIEGNDVYYMVGFVGSTLKQSSINKHAKMALESLKKAPCAR